MYPSQPSPFEQDAGSGRHGRWQPTDTDGYDPHLPEPVSGSRAAPAAGERTRIFPAIGTPGRDPDYPGPVSPAASSQSTWQGEPWQGEPNSGAGNPGYAAATTQISYSAAGYDRGVTYGGAGRSGTGRSRSGSRARGAGSRSTASSDLQVGLGSALAAGGGLLTLLFSFGPFVRYDNAGAVQRLAGQKIPLTFSAWSAETSLAPLTWLAGLAALALVGLVVLGVMTSDEQEFLGFRAGQVRVVLSLFSFLIFTGYALSGKGLVFGSTLNEAVASRFAAGDVSLAWGGHMIVISSLVAVVGTFLDYLGIGPTVWPPTPKPTGYQPRRGPDPRGYQYEPPAPGYTQQASYPGPYQQRSGSYGV